MSLYCVKQSKNWEIKEVKEPKKKMQDLQHRHNKGWLDKNLHGKTMNETAEFLDKNNNWKWM